MHELSVTRSILDTALDALPPGGGVRITRIDLAVGRFSGYIPRYITGCFGLLSPGTAAEGAELKFSEPPVTARCAACGCEFGLPEEDLPEEGLPEADPSAGAGQEAPARCPACGAEEFRIVRGGFDVFIERIVTEQCGSAGAGTRTGEAACGMAPRPAGS